MQLSDSFTTNIYPTMGRKHPYNTSKVLSLFIFKSVIQFFEFSGPNSGAPKSINISSLKRQHSNSSEEQIKASVNRWISLDDLTPPQSSEENSFNDYDGYLDEHFGSGSDTFMLPMAGTKKEKKQKKKTKPTGNYT